MAKQIHVTRSAPGNWGGLKSGAERRSFDGVPTQQKAIQIATGMARRQGGMEVVIHGIDGKIRDSNTIGKHDPFPPRG